MALKLAGHLQQLLGYGLVFLGLVVVTAALFVSGSYPAVPFWIFVTAAVVPAAPLMIVGGRINSRGRGIVLGQTPEHAAEEDRKGTVLFAAYLTFVGLVTLVIIWPVLLWPAGVMHPGDTFVQVWITGSLFFFCPTRYWVTRPAWGAIERRFQARRTRG